MTTDWTGTMTIHSRADYFCIFILQNHLGCSLIFKICIGHKNFKICSTASISNTLTTLAFDDTVYTYIVQNMNQIFSYKQA